MEVTKQKMKICAVTNVFNENFNLPIWLKHYGKQVGIKNCVVIDHGSDDDSTKNTGGASLITLPRSEFDDVKRANAVSSICEGLLNFFDYVIYSDADELIVPDLRKFTSLVDYLEKARPTHVTVKGFNLIHHLVQEAPLNATNPILSQRQYLHFLSPMCKTLITSRPIRWGGGFHSSSLEPSFGPIYMLHLRSVDLSEALKRLATTRALEWADPTAGRHQRESYVGLIGLFNDYSQYPVIENDELSFPAEEAEFLARIQLLGGKYYPPLDVAPSRLVKVPRWMSSVI